MMTTNDPEFGAAELLAPLRGATPEVSLASLQRAVAMAPKVAAVRLWGPLTAATMVVTLSIGGALLFRVGEQAVPLGVREVFGSNVGTGGTNGNPRTNDAAAVRSEQRHREAKSEVVPAGRMAALKPASDNILTEVPVSAVPTASVAMVPLAPLSRNATRTDVDDIRTRHEKGTEDAGDIYRFTAGLQAGVIYGSLNTLGGGFTASIEHDWQHLGFRYTSTFGQKTNSDQLFGRVADATKQYTQRVMEYGLLFGLTVRQGDFYATFAGGPNYAKSESLATDPSSPSTILGNRWQGIGFTTQASFGTQFPNGLGIDLTGFVSFHSQIMYGGTMLSLQYTITN